MPPPQPRLVLSPDLMAIASFLQRIPRLGRTVQNVNCITSWSKKSSYDKLNIRWHIFIKKYYGSAKDYFLSFP